MAKRYKHVISGALVSVRDEKVLGSEWESLDETPRSESPDDSWKVADLKSHADENGIELGAAKTKADILAAITAASTPSE